MSDQLHVILQPVQAERADDFERFLSDVVAPAVQARRPELGPRWRVLRSVETSQGVATFVILLEGGSLTEDWELDELLPAHFGEQEAQRLMAEWVETFAPLHSWAEDAVSTGQENNQLVWTLEPISVE